MVHFRRILGLIALVGVVATAPIAEANCAGTTCGATCSDYACVVVTDTYDTLACKPVATEGCMSFHSVTCCPRIPRE